MKREKFRRAAGRVGGACDGMAQLVLSAVQRTSLRRSSGSSALKMIPAKLFQKAPDGD
jgi:hypothetical protein